MSRNSYRQCPHQGKQSEGFALLPIIFFLLLLATLLTVGLTMFGPMVMRGKTTDTRETVEAAVKSVISWSQASGRLPTAGAEFISAVRNPNDAWGKSLVYIYDGNLTSIVTGGLCGKTSTTLAVTGIINVAFIIVSGGDDYTVDTSPNSSGAYSGTAAVNFKDIVRVVPLEELKNRAGCYGKTGGRLQIVNNELPKVCSGSSYSAGVYAVGGVPAGGSQYQWCIQGNLPAGITATPNTVCPSWSINATNLQLSATNVSGTTASVIFMAKDSDINPNVIQKTLPIVVSTCGAHAPDIQTGIPGAPNNAASTALSQNIVSNNPGGSSTITVQNNIITFGNNQNNGAGCVWHPNNFPLLGKTMRAFWNFCLTNIDTSANSTTYADGYTFTVMQGSNPTTYCGTGSPYDATTNPYYDCTYSGHLGEFLSYCGLPGQNMAVEFDIYPSASRNDPSGSYNHVGIVKALASHSGPPLAGTYGDNTHNVWGNPACGSTCNPACNGTCAGGTCTGTCNGAAINNAVCAGTCYGTCTGTCSGTGTACIYDNLCSHNLPVTWYEDGCSANYNNHDARVEIHTRCNTNCSACEQQTCTSKSLIKVWVDKGDNNLNADNSTTPDISYCSDLPVALNQVKVGFTQGTGASVQLGRITNLSVLFDGGCARPSITTASLPNGLTFTPYSATMSGSGGTTPYTWSASNLPPGLSINSSGTISGTPSTTGTYNTVLVSLTDNCNSDVCANTVSKDYTIQIQQLQAPTCTLSANPTIVYGSGTSNLTWTITNGPANGSWSPNPGGTCSSFSNSNGGTCTTGNITNPGSNTFTLTVSNTAGSNICSATVTNCPSVSISTASLPNGALSTAYSANVSGGGGLTPYTWSASNLPPGLSINSSTGTISGRPTAVGAYNNATVTLTDNCPSQQQVSRTFTIVIYRYRAYSVRNSTGARFWVRGGTYNNCTRINSTNAFNVNLSDGSAVNVYSNNTCTTLRTTVSFLNANSTDEAGNRNSRVQINNAWQLIDR